MATYDFNVSAVEIVKSALRIFGALEEAEDPDASQLQDGMQALNMLIKTWQKQAIHLWRKTEGVLFLNYGQSRYLLGPAGDRAAEETDFIETRMAGAQSAGATSITLDSTAGMAAADQIGIFVNAQLRHWTTIVSVDTTTTLTITAALPADTLDNATVFTYTELIQRPLRILQGRRRAGGPEVGEIPTFDLSRNYYFDLTTRSTALGLPVEHHYTPILNNGELYLWPVPNNVDYLFKFTFTKPFADIDVNSDLADVPQEWLDPLKFNLAAKIMHEYRVPLAERQVIKAEAVESLEQALEFDREVSPVYIQPDYRARR